MIEPKANFFEKYYTLEEAAGMLGAVRTDLLKARRELRELRDSIILLKRMMTRTKIEGNTPGEEEKKALQEKVKTYEALVQSWAESFQERGIILRDFERGLIDFPYRSRKTGQEFLLCWHLEDEGLFYFHGVSEGFPGRKPITLLPD